MIRVFRVDGLELMLNVEMIEGIQPGHPTVITLVNGEAIQVKNTLTDVLTKIWAHRKGIEDEDREFESGRPGDGDQRPPTKGNRSF